MISHNFRRYKASFQLLDNYDHNMVQIIFVGAFIIAIMTRGIASNQGPKYGMISKTPSIIPRTSAYGSLYSQKSYGGKDTDNKVQ